jgi:hypothetical protein
VRLVIAVCMCSSLRCHNWTLPHLTTSSSCARPTLFAVPIKLRLYSQKSQVLWLVRVASLSFVFCSRLVVAPCNVVVTLVFMVLPPVAKSAILGYLLQPFDVRNPSDVAKYALPSNPAAETVIAILSSDYLLWGTIFAIILSVNVANTCRRCARLR